MIPAHLLPHDVVRIQPGAAADAYGDPSSDWSDEAVTRTAMKAFVQPAGEREVLDGRDAQIADWILFTNVLDIDGGDRIEWSGRELEVLGPPAIQSTPRGPSHAEARLREVHG